MNKPKSKTPWYHYLLTHWRGQQGLMWSFWVNLVGLRVAIFAMQKYFDPGVGNDHSAYAYELLSFGFVAHGLVLIWQVVGVLRSSERFILRGGSIVNVWGSYLGLLIAFWMSLSYAFDTWQWTLPYPGKNWQVETPDKFKISIENSGKVARISGDIGLGLTKKFKVILDQHPKIQTVVLNSHGGNVYEARGVSKLIRDRGLSTRVEKVCHSSCTTIFIGGKSRSVLKAASLGFHKYRMSVNYQVGFSNIELEQKRDRSLFLSAGVKDAFVDKMFAYDANEMWFPNLNQLRQAGVVTTAKHNQMQPNLLPQFFHASINGDAFNQSINLAAFL